MRVGKQIRLRDKQRGYLSAAMKLILFGGVAPSFELPLNDKGAGEVNLVPSRASGSATPTFTRATTAYTTLADGSLYQVASGVPRSCYSAAGVYLGYLAEGARTNLCLQSQTFGTTWIASDATLSADATTAPDGTTTADKIIEAATTARHTYRQATGTTGTTAFAWSIFVKAAERTFATVMIGNARATYAQVNLSTGVFGAFTGLEAANLTASATNVGGGWWRLTITGAFSISDDQILWVGPSDGNHSYAGDITKGIYVWGAQLEAASFASSYIPTTTAAVTRNAEVDGYPSASNIATTGAFVAELTPISATSRTGYVFGSYTDANNSLALLFDGTNLIARKRIGGTDYDATIAYTMAAGTTVKVGMRWGADGVDVWLNGAKGTGNANATTAVIATTFQIGADGNSANQPFASIKNGKAYPRALSDSKMASLAT